MHLLLVILAAAPVELSYGTGALQLEKLAPTPDATLAQQIVACIKGYGVTRLEKSGAPAKLIWDASTDAIGDHRQQATRSLISPSDRRARPDPAARSPA